MLDIPPIEKELNACTACGDCDLVCPGYQEIPGDDASPMFRVLQLRKYDRRNLRDLAFRRTVKINERFARSVYICTACGMCEEVCPVDIRFSSLWDTVKAWLVEKGFEPISEHRQTCENVLRNHNILGEPHEKRGDWMAGADVKQAEYPDIVFWVGCMQSYRQPQVATAVVKLLNAAGVKYRILGTDEWCSGSPLLRLGYQAMVKKELMQHNFTAIAGTGAKAIVTACAECYRTFIRDYRELGGAPPFVVHHITEYVNMLVKTRKLKFGTKIEKKATYHDPCLLGRHCGYYEPPRDSLKLVPGLERLEMDANQKNALCSGAGGGFPQAFPKQALNVAFRRLEQAKKTGANLLLTSCPFAKERFQEAAQKKSGGLETKDITEILADAL